MFLKPYLILLLIPIILINILLLIKNSSKNIVRNIFWTVIFSLIVFSLSRPYKEITTIKTSSSKKTGFILFDASLSMSANDLKPNRLWHAKRKLLDFLDIISSQEVDFEIGLMLFAGTPHVYCPLTKDIEILKSYTRNIELNLIQSKGSDISSAINQAAINLKSQNIEDAFIFLISDGEKDKSNFNYNFNENYKVHGLSIGTIEGAPITDKLNSFIKDNSGNIIISKREDAFIQKIASESNGSFRVISLDNSDIENIILEINKSSVNNKESETEISINSEYGSYLLLTSLILLFVVGLFNKNMVFLSLILFFVYTPSSKAETRSSYEAYKHFNKNEFKKAEKKYREALIKEKNYKNLNGLGSSLYKQNKFSESKEIFEENLKIASSDNEKFKSHYNLGNNNLMLKKYKDAIKSYEKALEIKKEDKQSFHNLEVAKKLLNEEEQKKEKKEKKKKKQDKKDNKDKKKDKEKDKKKDKDEDKDKNQNQNDQDKDQEKDEEQDHENSQDKDKDKDKDKDDNSEQKKEQEKLANDKEDRDTKGELKEAEARKWLDSLPETPLLLQKKGVKKNNTEHFW